jgi:large subunit ribosomal protein L4
MKDISVINLEGKNVKNIKLNKDIFGITPNDAVLYDAIRLARNNQRIATANTKTRSEVSGGGKKPWRQKGTGRARQGSIRAPHWYHGGVVFGPSPERNYTLKMNKKERKLALKSALATKALNESIIVIENFDLTSLKTKDAISTLKALNLNDTKTLIVVKEITENMILATRNLTKIILLSADEINVYDIVAAEKMLIEEEALKQIEEVLS